MRGDGEEREREKLGERKREQALNERCRAGGGGTGAIESNDARDGLQRTCASPEPSHPPSHTVYRGPG